MGQRILVVEDERPIADILRFHLEREGYQVEVAWDGEEAVARAREIQPDLIVLDLMLPKRDGFSVCREVRRTSSVPILILTAKENEVDKVLGLELGADDYVTKPFSPRELVARVKAVLRRLEKAAAAAAPPERLAFPDFTIDLAARVLTVRGKPVDCPPKEFDLLATFARNPHRVFTREQLLEKVWDYSFYGDFRTVDVHVQRLRRKIEPDPEKPRYIKTVWGVGYRFEPGDGRPPS